MITTTYLVDGMSCSHCVNAVKEEVGQLAGVRSVEVDLVPEKTSKVTVTSDSPLDDQVVTAAITEAGYDVVG
ncbi:MAG: cation transporter [Bifidobacteriaceae bacterium]|jgi:copper ion binding protein|nr:cation transporter [Bifidobacteriaceae bacterium]